MFNKTSTSRMRNILHPLLSFFLQELLVLSSGDLLLLRSGEAGEGGSGDRGSGDSVGGRYECVATFSSGTNITMAIFEVELDSGKTDHYHLPSSFLFL